MAVVQCELVQLWKCQALRLRLLYCNWKPKQSGNPFISCHVWFLPFLMSLWLTALISIILLALYVQEAMDVGEHKSGCERLLIVCYEDNKSPPAPRTSNCNLNMLSHRSSSQNVFTLPIIQRLWKCW